MMCVVAESNEPQQGVYISMDVAQVDGKTWSREIMWFLS
jgi:hypothetical protein